MPGKTILFGLGNPGKRYENTRHNVGFHLLEKIRIKWNGEWHKENPAYQISLTKLKDKDILLVKPLTFMNNSGEALSQLRKSADFQLDDLVVLCDDFNLPLGNIRLRRGGSDGGHNGLRSVISHLVTTAFPRLRLGIGPVLPGADPAGFVLSAFGPEEDKVVGEMLGRAAECIEVVLTIGFDEAMARFNAGLR